MFLALSLSRPSPSWDFDWHYLIHFQYLFSFFAPFYVILVLEETPTPSAVACFSFARAIRVPSKSPVREIIYDGMMWVSCYWNENSVTRAPASPPRSTSPLSSLWQPVSWQERTGLIWVAEKASVSRHLYANPEWMNDKYRQNSCQKWLGIYRIILFSSIW